MRTPSIVLLSTLLLACSQKSAGALGSASGASSAPPPARSAIVAVDDANGFVVVDVPASKGELVSAVRDEAAKAKSKGLKPFVEFAAGWCEPCQAIKKSLGDPLMKDAFKGTYIIRLDADDWGEHLAGSGFSPSAIPVFYEVNDAGKPTGRTIDGGAWEDNVPKNMAPALGAFFHKS